MTNLFLHSRYQNALEDEVSFLTHLKLRQGIILEYTRLRAKMDEITFADALKITPAELKKLKSAPGVLSPQLTQKLKMLL